MSVQAGKIAQIIGPVIDITFNAEGSELPKILDALEVTRPDGVVVESCLPRWLCFARLLPFALWSGLDAVSLEDLSDAFLADRVTQFAAFEQAGDLGGAIARTFTGDADDRLDDMSRDRRSAAALASRYFVSVFAR